MTTQLTRGRVRAAAFALCGVAAIAVAACATPASGTVAGPQQPAAVTAAAAAGAPVVVDCAGHAQTRPAQYILACGDGGAYLAGLHWETWGPSWAFAEGISTLRDCVPSCPGGHGHSFPVLVALWHAEPLPGHAGEHYFSQLTLIYTGSRTYRAGGKLYQLPVTATDPLSSDGGA
jgi:hypothetical protein